MGERGSSVTEVSDKTARRTLAGKQKRASCIPL
jgi:hypothetical protein